MDVLRPADDYVHHFLSPFADVKVLAPTAERTDDGALPDFVDVAPADYGALPDFVDFAPADYGALPDLVDISAAE